jgi:hypothetical protein
MTVKGLSLLTAHMTHLRGLECHFHFTWPPSLVFPAGLRSLYVSFVSDIMWSAEPFSDQEQRHFDAAIQSIAALSRLESLRLSAWQATGCNLTPLTRLSLLHTLTLELKEAVCHSADILRTLRRMSHDHLRSLDFGQDGARVPRSLRRRFQRRSEGEPMMDNDGEDEEDEEDEEEEEEEDA